MPDTTTTDVPIPIDANLASALDDAETRAAAGRLVSKMLRNAAIGQVFEAIDALKADAHRRGLTDEILDAELAAYNAEHRDVDASLPA